MSRLRDGGRIVLVSSGATVTHRLGSALYATGKVAGEQLVRVLDQELAPRAITVNSVLPVPYAPTRWPPRGSGRPTGSPRRSRWGRIGEPDDIAGFLISEEAGGSPVRTLPTSGGAF